MVTNDQLRCAKAEWDKTHEEFLELKDKEREEEKKYRSLEKEYIKEHIGWEAGDNFKKGENLFRIKEPYYDFKDNKIYILCYVLPIEKTRNLYVPFQVPLSFPLELRLYDADSLEDAEKISIEEYDEIIIKISQEKDAKK